MPNKKSAKKELRKSKKLMISNKKVKNDLKTLLNKSKKEIISKSKEAQELTKKSLKALDKAVKKGIIKKNTGSRKKSRLQKALNSLSKK